MRLFARASSDLTSLATGLSLVIANYKPTPQLPTANGTGSNSSASQELLPSSSKGNLFQVQSAQMMASQSQRPEDEWGMPSVLYIPDSSSSTEGANTFASSGKTVGDGKCPVQDTYTPTGGWNKLPSPVYDAFDPVMANVYRYRQQQGVDLGAW